MIEKRQHRRFRIPLNINVESVEEGLKPFQSTKLNDISIGGASFGVAGDVSVGSEFEISLEDNESDFASALGLVTDNSGPLVFRMHARVLRASMDKDSTRQNVAVEFCSPLRIAPLSA